MSGATVPFPVESRSGIKLALGAGTHRQAPGERKAVTSALQLWSVRLIISVVIGMLLILAVVEAIRLRSYYQESGWVARLAVWYDQQAMAADSKAKTLRRQMDTNEDTQVASRLDEEATGLEQQSQVWKKQAQQAHEAAAQRRFDWLPKAFWAPHPGG